MELVSMDSSRRVFKRSYRRDVGMSGHIGWIVAGSLATGLIAALLLVAAPFIPPTEAGVTGAVLCGLALGCAMLAVCAGSTGPGAACRQPGRHKGAERLRVAATGSRHERVVSGVGPVAHCLCQGHEGHI